MKKFYIVIVFLVLFYTAGCKNQSEPVAVPPEPMAQTEESQPEVKEEPTHKTIDNQSGTTEVLNGGETRIQGVIRYEGEVPKFREIKMDADPVCLTHHAGEKVLPQTLLLGDDKTMANVFVRVKNGLPNKNFPAPTEEVVVTQKGCVYTPHVFGVMVGQPLKILNPDGTLHNVHALAKSNAEFNLAMPKFRKEVTKSFDKPEMHIPFKCDVHPWMLAYGSVMSHPFYDVTEEDGLYKLDQLPPGTYLLEAWHERLGTQEVSVTIGEGESKTVDFTFKKPE